MRILVTGGCGYIGSHMVRVLVRAGHEVSVVDDLSRGHDDTLLAGVHFAKLDVRDSAVRELMKERRIEAVFHFASRIEVGESMREPRLYFTGNLAAGIALLEHVLDAGVRTFVLSSTAAVYGNPVYTPIDEAHPTVPINAYGSTKLSLESALAYYGRAYALKYAALRYFNAAGAWPEEGLGERHDPETHLIPIVIEAALGKRPPLTVFGTDYETPDGTCVRDYVHVRDLAEAHLAGLEHLDRGGESGAFNLGTGIGHSVREVIACVERVGGKKVPLEPGQRRAGDPPVLVALPERAARVMGWTAKRAALEDIVRDAWAWHARG
jgi:UDP-glucose 4-epimerase